MSYEFYANFNNVRGYIKFSKMADLEFIERRFAKIETFSKHSYLSNA